MQQQFFALLSVIVAFTGSPPSRQPFPFASSPPPLVMDGSAAVVRFQPEPADWDLVVGRVDLDLALHDVRQPAGKILNVNLTWPARETTFPSRSSDAPVDPVSIRYVRIRF